MTAEKLRRSVNKKVARVPRKKRLMRSFRRQFKVVFKRARR